MYKYMKYVEYQTTFDFNLNMDNGEGFKYIMIFYFICKFIKRYCLCNYVEIKDQDVIDSDKRLDVLLE